MQRIINTRIIKYKDAPIAGKVGGVTGGGSGHKPAFVGQVTGTKVARLMAKTYFASTGKFDPQGRSGPKVRRIQEYAEHAKSS